MKDPFSPPLEKKGSKTQIQMVTPSKITKKNKEDTIYVSS